MREKLPLIDLFAGCGGLSLGLELAGFEPVFVNELHKDALATYIGNRKHTNLGSPRGHCNDIREISRNSSTLEAFSRMIKREYREIALIAGGPPCQGYSGRGIRTTFRDWERSEVPSNRLYRDMARVVEAVGPRMFLFENVSGLVNARWTRDGEPGQIWNSVQRAFSNIAVKRGRKSLGYKIEFRVVRAREFGIPQNRPRLLMVGLREDLDFPDLGSLLPTGSDHAPDLKDLLGDLVDSRMINGGVTSIYPKSPSCEIQRELRSLPSGRVLSKGDRLLEHEYSFHSQTVLRRYSAMIKNNGRIPPELETKKFAQRLLPEKWSEVGPTITATSAPDDYVHFSQPRILTVREWARLQTFPDHYVFCGKRTTGGRRRAGDPSLGIWDRELPKYTQIGNAVPVNLARQLGEHFKKIIG